MPRESHNISIPDDPLDKALLERRFWSKVSKTDGCWLWLGTISKNGYGNFGVGGKNHGAHRVAYRLTRGAIPDGMYVLHKCDNRACVNPDHLVLGTHEDNVADTVAKGRNIRGERHPNARLTVETVLLIRKLCTEQWMSYEQVSKQLGVPLTTIAAVAKGDAWKHVGGPLRTFNRALVREHKLPPDKEAEVAMLAESGCLSQRKIARLYGVSPHIVRRIIAERQRTSA